MPVCSSRVGAVVSSLLPEPWPGSLEREKQEAKWRVGQGLMFHVFLHTGRQVTERLGATSQTLFGSHSVGACLTALNMRAGFRFPET